MTPSWRPTALAGRIWGYRPFLPFSDKKKEAKKNFHSAGKWRCEVCFTRERNGILKETRHIATFARNQTNQKESECICHELE